MEDYSIVMIRGKSVMWERFGHGAGVIPEPMGLYCKVMIKKEEKKSI